MNGERKKCLLDLISVLAFNPISFSICSLFNSAACFLSCFLFSLKSLTCVWMRGLLMLTDSKRSSAKGPTFLIVDWFSIIYKIDKMLYSSNKSWEREWPNNTTDTHMRHM